VTASRKLSLAPVTRRPDGRVRFRPADRLDWYRPAVRSRTSAGVSIDHLTLGLTNEAGEVAGKVKKIFRDHGGVITDADRDALALELGDVLWYLTEI
jgi:hypothetical protein